jgi:glycosyltransferase involved in cell wall biosynthesis
MEEKLLSIIVPCHNEEECIPLFYTEAERVRTANGLSFEYLFVDDGSSDATLDVLRALAADHPGTVRYLSFSRNFGKEAALYAGLKNARGGYVTVMDADLQDPPDMLPEMLRLIEEEGYDCVGTARTTRSGESPLRSLLSRAFYFVINSLSDTEIVHGARDFRLMTRQMIDAVLEMSEYNRFSKGLFTWVGFKTIYLPYENRERAAGTTAWSLPALLRYSLEGIVNFSSAPLSFASYVGLFSCIGALIALIFIVIRTLIYGDPTSGWPSMVCIFILFGGLQLLCIGILGKYVSKIFLETKHRPLYILRESDDGGGAPRRELRV